MLKAKEEIKESTYIYTTCMCKVVAEWPQKLIKIAKRTLQVKKDSYKYSLSTFYLEIVIEKLISVIVCFRLCSLKNVYSLQNKNPF